jgi:CheY-like chemotaxis protein
MRAKILLLQEIEYDQDCVKRALNPDRYELVSTRSYREAIKEIENATFDVIVSAVHLKSGNVFELLQYAKSSQSNKSSPFVFFCAEPSEFARCVSPAIRTAGKVLGADEYITMDPFDENKFKSAIDKLLLESGSTADGLLANESPSS